VFHHVDRWRFLVEPAGEETPPHRIFAHFLARQHGNLHESAGQRRAFPRRGAFTTGETDHHVTDAARFTRLHLDLARDIVALVDQAQRGHAIGQRRADACSGLHRRGRRGGQFLRDFGFLCRRRRCFAAARDQRQRAKGRGGPVQREAAQAHASGVQAW
jgi:hypothetical protein